MADPEPHERSLPEQLLDLLVFVPAGLAVTAVEELPELASKGRSRFELHLRNARFIGQLVVTKGQHDLGNRVGQVVDAVRRKSDATEEDAADDDTTATAAPEPTLDDDVADDWSDESTEEAGPDPATGELDDLDAELDDLDDELEDLEHGFPEPSDAAGTPSTDDVTVAEHDASVGDLDAVLPATFTVGGDGPVVDDDAEAELTAESAGAGDLTVPDDRATVDDLDAVLPATFAVGGDGPIDVDAEDDDATAADGESGDDEDHDDDDEDYDAQAGEAPAVDEVDAAIAGYDTLSASQVVRRLEGLGRQELTAVYRYESATRGRRTILYRAQQLLEDGPATGEGSADDADDD